MNVPGKYLVAGVILFVVGLIAGGAIVYFATGGTSSEVDQAEDVAKVKEVWNEYSASLNNEDFERWIALWIDDGIQQPPDEPRYVGIEQISQANKPAFELFVYDDFHIDPAGIQILGDTAYSHGTYGFSMAPVEGGDTVDVTGKFLTILEKQDDGSWKLAIDTFNYSPSE
jgi:uncharacterized protein (TIGR02246 family)